MKTEEEIREKLEKLYALRNMDKWRDDYMFQHTAEIKIELLEWVLNNK